MSIRFPGEQCQSWPDGSHTLGNGTAGGLQRGAPTATIPVPGKERSETSFDPPTAGDRSNCTRERRCFTTNLGRTLTIVRNLQSRWQLFQSDIAMVQPLHDGLVSVHFRRLLWGYAVFIFGVPVRARVQQRRYGGLVSVSCCPVQRRLAVFVHGVQIRARVQQRLYGDLVSGICRLMQRSLRSGNASNVYQCRHRQPEPKFPSHAAVCGRPHRRRAACKPAAPPVSASRRSAWSLSKSGPDEFIAECGLHDVEIRR